MKKAYIYVVVILLLITGCKNGESKKEETGNVKSNETSNIVSNITSNEESNNTSNVTSNTVSNENKNQSNNNKVDTEQGKTIENTKDYTDKKSYDEIGAELFKKYSAEVKISADKKSATINMDLSELNKDNTISTIYSKLENVKIANFSGKINKVYLCEMGQDKTGLTLIFLMEDGSLEYTKLFKLNSKKTSYTLNTVYEFDNNGVVKDEYYSSNGKINNVNGVTKLYRASMPGGITVLAVKNDGSYYDLSKAI